MKQQDIPIPPVFNVMVKPAGPACNLACKYCFYLDKTQFFSDNETFRMSDDILEKFTKDYIEALENIPEINYSWQGGEPTILGVDFFRKAIDLQKKYANGKKITNALQTNGTLIDDEWCEFFKENNFLIGVSIDGPRDLHDTFRIDKKNKGSFDDVVRGIELFKKHKIDFNALTVVNQLNSQHPLKVYHFLKNLGVEFIQFIPIVEQKVFEPENEVQAGVTDLSVKPKEFGKFLSKIFDEWVTKDVGKTFVQQFDAALGNWLGVGGAVCVYSAICGNSVILEHNGDLYSCDHFMYPDYKLGNIMEKDLREMVYSDFQIQFGRDKFLKLPTQCKECKVIFACRGGCPKHRFLKTSKNEKGLNYLCKGYKYFYLHIAPAMDKMAKLLNEGKLAEEIMKDEK
jgi:uncharacterized protein